MPTNRQLRQIHAPCSCAWRTLAPSVR
jgi:hypothetical protein